MAGTPLWARLGGWRVSRHPVVRWIYERLDRAGIVLAQLDRFERSTATSPPDGPALPDAIELTRTTPADRLPATLNAAPVAPEDRLLLARRADTTVGWCLLSARPVYVPELHRRLSFDGAYLWRLYVTPNERGQGIGSALVMRAIQEAATALNETQISALVAPDNLPSRRAFANAGFTPIERFTSVGYRDWRYDRREQLTTR